MGVGPARWSRALITSALALSVGACMPVMPGAGRNHMPGHMEEMMGGRSAADRADAPLPVPSAREIEVEAGDLWFAPRRIEIAAGEPVNITVTNAGRIFHDFVITELGFALDLDPGATVTGGLEVAVPGSYTFVCTVPGHAAAGMRGTLDVR